MNIISVIDKKRLKQHLTYEELDYSFNGYLKDLIPDYQMSALLMAICINGLDDEEIFDLTEIFIKSGEVLDLSSIDGLLVDKHSTGGVGDKTTMVIGPIVASCGLKMAKMSGRGLGLTGGTIDKLESIPGFRCDLSIEEFISQVDKVGYANMSQSSSLAPMDKKIYALRDVSGTCESIGLIAVSIMSKKIASGTKNILLDIKYGNGALIKTKEDAYKFSVLVRKIGKKYNCNVKTVIDSMNIPLGNNIGNSLEVLEAIDILKGKKGYLSDLCLKLAATLISMAKNIDLKEALCESQEVIKNQKAYHKFLEFVAAQHGDIKKLKVSSNILVVKAKSEGILKDINAHKIALLASSIGCFRKTKEEPLDHSVGIVLNKQLGDKIKINDELCYLYVKEKNMDLCNQALDCFRIKES